MGNSPNYNINYEDERFQSVEADKNQALQDMNNKYDQMVNQSDKYFQDQINANKEYADKQQQIQQQNTDLTIEKIENQKDQANKDYQKEQAGAYQDWQKQSNQYGVNAEVQAQQGLNNSGYSESSQVSMYNTYQNRVSTARETYNKAIVEYDIAIKDAKIQNNAKLAEIAYQALQMQLELSLKGFQYKNTLLMEQMNKQQELDNIYYSRYQDVLNQMNTENAMAEEIRQYNESMKLEQDKFAESKKQWEQQMQFEKDKFTESKNQFEKQHSLEIKKYDESIRQFNEEIKRLKEKDAKEYEMEIKRLEEQKRQANIAKANADREYELKKQQMAQQQAQWEKEYNLKKQSMYRSSRGSSSRSRSSGSRSRSSSPTVARNTSNTSRDPVVQAYINAGGTSPYSAKGLLQKGLVQEVNIGGKKYYQSRGNKKPLFGGVLGSLFRR